MAIISEKDQKILNRYISMIMQSMKESADRGERPQSLESYRAMMLKINPYKKPPGYKEADVASFQPKLELRPGLTASVAIPKGKGPFPVMIHAHGHGLRAGSSPEYSPWMRVMASYGFVVMYPDYRWQPEYTYADQVDDMLFSIKWVQQNAARINADAAKMILGGDSAGGGLAMDILLRTLADPAGPRFRAFESVDGFIAGQANMGTADQMKKITPEMPFPPLIMIVGSDDNAAQSALAGAAACYAAKKPYELQVYYGMPHDFAKFPELDVMHEANDRLMKFLRKTV